MLTFMWQVVCQNKASGYFIPYTRRNSPAIHCALCTANLFYHWAVLCLAILTLNQIFIKKHEVELAFPRFVENSLH